MDAQDGRDQCCQKHLHGNRNPADEQTYSYATRNRSSVEVPHHGLGNSVPDPAPERARSVVCTPNLVVQLAAKIRRVRQMLSQPVAAHFRFLEREKRKTQHNNVVASFLLNYSQRILECYPESVGRI